MDWEPEEHSTSTPPTPTTSAAAETERLALSQGPILRGVTRSKQKCILETLNTKGGDRGERGRTQQELEDLVERLLQLKPQPDAESPYS